MDLYRKFKFVHCAQYLDIPNYDNFNQGTSFALKCHSREAYILSANNLVLLSNTTLSESYVAPLGNNELIQFSLRVYIFMIHFFIGHGILVIYHSPAHMTERPTC